jgi:hypothetical protein
MVQQQPDPQPPSQPVQDGPALSIYIGLFVVAVLLIGIAFISNLDIDGLLLNLATELLGALIILAVVERRLRNEDAKAIQDLFFSLTQDSRTTVKYAKVLERQILNVNPISRPEFDDLLQKYPKGFMLCGLGGSGKSTLVQKLTVDQCVKVRQSPRTEKIPVFVLIREWDMQTSLEDYLRSVAQKYYVIKDKFYNEWFQNGRLMIVIDGLDECRDIPFALNAVEQMCAKNKGNSIIVVSRKKEDVCGLPVVNISGMTTKQALAMFSETISQTSIESIDERLLHQLAEKLEGHPLAIRIATGLINSSDNPTEAVQKLLSDLSDIL